MKKTLAINCICVFSLIVFIFGCSTKQGLIGNNKYIKKTIPFKNGHFAEIIAVEADGALTVSGKIRPIDAIGEKPGSQVEVSLLKEDETILETQIVKHTPIYVPLPNIPKRINGINMKLEYRFTAHFLKSPPAGTIIRVSSLN